MKCPFLPTLYVKRRFSKVRKKEKKKNLMLYLMLKDRSHTRKIPKNENFRERYNFYLLLPVIEKGEPTSCSLDLR